MKQETKHAKEKNTLCSEMMILCAENPKKQKPKLTHTNGISK